jgi:predicted Rossmann fold flavoprotein
VKKFDAIVVGGGPAGMMAAIRAGERGKSVLLIEKKKVLGMKLAISGKGRCNLTNACEIDEFLEKFASSGVFLRNAFAKFFNTDLVNFFEASGLKLKEERGGRVFPKSDKAEDVLKILRGRLEKTRVQVLNGERVKSLMLKDKKTEGVVLGSGKRFLSNHVAIATGGLSYPKTGSTGDGYAMAREAGHDVIRPEPALVPVIIKEVFPKEWQGVSLKNIALTLYIKGKKRDTRFGEMIFTHFGLSGPIVLDMSAGINEALKSGEKVTLSINFKPALDYPKLDKRLLREFKNAPNRSLKNIFEGLLPKKLIERFLEYASCPRAKKANQVTVAERKNLINSLFDFRLTVKNLRPLEEAIVTAGGVNTKEINPKTMQSRIIEGLFFAGEVIDVDAKTGGYNMQAAFSTGWVLGDNI